jgi:hypothetical protein
MDWGSPEFVLVLVAFGVLGWLVNNWMRMRHGIPTDEQLGIIAAREARQDSLANAQLIEQNRELTALIGRLEERMAVLERIATDPAERTSREIEQLRLTPTEGKR